MVCPLEMGKPIERDPTNLWREYPSSEGRTRGCGEVLSVEPQYASHQVSPGFRSRTPRDFIGGYMRGVLYPPILVVVNTHLFDSSHIDAMSF